MKILVSIGLAAACLLASPALAGPAGTGLTFTEEVAKKNLQKRAAQVQTACDAPKATDKAPPANASSAEAKATTPDTCRAS